MSEFVRVASVSDLPDPGKKLIEVDDRLVVLFHVDGEFYCLDDLCTHDGGPLSDGPLENHHIACPRHGAKFDICSGKAISMPATEATSSHPTKVENGEVFVQIIED